MNVNKINVFWFRRDLRWDDNHALYLALSEKIPVLPVFIYDRNILDELPENDHRVSLIYDRLSDLNLLVANQHSSGIFIFKGKPAEAFEFLTQKYHINKVFANEDYEPYAAQRDGEIQQLLDRKEIELILVRDHIILSLDEIKSDSEEIYRVYTPFSKKWKSIFEPATHLKHYPSEKLLENLMKLPADWHFPSLQEIGFKPSTIQYHLFDFQEMKKIISNYHQTRDNFSFEKGTTNVSTALRFGLISIRKLFKMALNNQKYFNELIWREFFQYLIYHFPFTVKDDFRQIDIPQENNEAYFEKWKNASTGVPIIDAAMHQLNSTGYMHNRLRMVVANYLTKILWIDWRWGERYFAEKLFDFELASNVGNWQWAAGTGADAAPYFRIFNPWLQQQKFDPNLVYLKKWLPYDLEDAPKPIVDFSERRNLYLKMMKK
ncbi:MAG: deoxyribodipyrimidine photo-lyase [Vicingaceae bacterium]|nr:MAG: deoxyribodipyrimidine photo-lyase [Vicingaceae bacterium]